MSAYDENAAEFKHKCECGKTNILKLVLTKLTDYVQLQQDYVTKTLKNTTVE